jgi:hypothetical protein
MLVISPETETESKRMIKATYTLTKEEYLKTKGFLSETHNVLRRSAVILNGIALLMASVLIVIHYANSHSTLPSWFLLLQFVLPAAQILILGAPMWYYGRKYANSDLANKRIECEISEDSFVWTIKNSGTTKYNWNSAKGVSEHPDGFLISPIPKVLLWLSKAAFADETSLKNFKNVLFRNKILYYADPNPA